MTIKGRKRRLWDKVPAKTMMETHLTGENITDNIDMSRYTKYTNSHAHPSTWLYSSSYAMPKSLV